MGAWGAARGGAAEGSVHPGDERRWVEQLLRGCPGSGALAELAFRYCVDVCGVPDSDAGACRSQGRHAEWERGASSVCTVATNDGQTRTSRRAISALSGRSPLRGHLTRRGSCWRRCECRRCLGWCCRGVELAGCGSCQAGEHACWRRAWTWCTCWTATDNTRSASCSPPQWH